MSLTCKIAGHKWNGCTCVRCNEHRDEGHDYVTNIQLCTSVCSRCGKLAYVHDWQGFPCALKCSRCGIEAPHYVKESHQWEGCACRVCGEPTKPLIGEYMGEHMWDGCMCSRCKKTRDEGHDWQGCKCVRCGKTRDEGHTWAAVKPQPANRSGHPVHTRPCSVCGARSSEPHRLRKRFKSTCNQTCVDCGYETVWHEFRDGVCVSCGLDENEHYCELLLSGKVRYYDREYSPVDDRSVTYIDHVNSVSALRRIGLSKAKHIYSNCKVICAEKLRDIAAAGGPDARKANETLRDLVLDGDLGWDLPMVAQWITDPEIASDPKVVEAVRLSEKASIDYDNAMIAADSGIGRSG